MRNLFGAVSFALSFVFAEHAFINMSEHAHSIWRLDNIFPWFIIAPLFVFGVYAFFTDGKVNEKTNG